MPPRFSSGLDQERIGGAHCESLWSLWKGNERPFRGKDAKVSPEARWARQRLLPYVPGQIRYRKQRESRRRPVGSRWREHCRSTPGLAGSDESKRREIEGARLPDFRPGPSPKERGLPPQRVRAETGGASGRGRGRRCRRSGLSRERTCSCPGRARALVERAEARAASARRLCVFDRRKKKPPRRGRDGSLGDGGGPSEA